ncbi:uncharacterized protein LOC130665667 [Microplitis mediator]|uniref:uncharacterized protein LOC130665667 n=1 Tax=Microplitis mediator TaxID=375433 RepID=UPI0025546218|nr:uncharacterized protein LOC130665667 [Microplitis mediator]
MRMFEIFVILTFINKSINMCVAVPLDIYLQDVHFVVGIFDGGARDPNQMNYLNQGVLITQKIVLTPSVNVLGKKNLRVRVYPWQEKSGPQGDHKAEKSVYLEHKVEENSLFPELSQISYLILDKPYFYVNPINYLDSNDGGLSGPGNKCTIVKLKWSNRILKQINHRQVRVKQRAVESPFYYLENKYSRNADSDPTKRCSLASEFYFCIEEIGKKNCHSYPGAALICESRGKPGYHYLAGIEIFRKNCQVMFGNTQALQESIENLQDYLNDK